MNERLKELRNALNISQVDFSEKIQVGSSTLAMWELGSRKIKDIHISRICAEFHVSEEWLRTGIGSMFAETDNTAFNAFANEYNLNDITRAAILALAKLPEDNRAILISAIRSIAAACDVVDDRADYADEDAIAHETRIAPGIIERELAKKGIS